MTKLTNTFHNTEYNSKRTRTELRIIAHNIYNGVATQTQRKALYRVRQALCGVKDCTCGDELGERQ